MSSIEIDFGNDGFVLKVDITLDGNKWCVGIGPFPTGIYAFDKNPVRAIEKLKSLVRNA